MKQPIAKKKLAAMKESDMEQQKLTILKSVNEGMKLRDKRKKVGGQKMKSTIHISIRVADFE